MTRQTELDRQWHDTGLEDMGIGFAHDHPSVKPNGDPWHDGLAGHCYPGCPCRDDEPIILNPSDVLMLAEISGISCPEFD